MEQVGDEAFSGGGDGGPPDIRRLPAELLLLILKALPFQARGTAAQVCHQWKDLAFDKSLWLPLRFSEATWREKSRLDVPFSRLIDLFATDVEELDVSFCETNLEHATLQRTLGRCVNLRSLSLAWCRQVTDDVLWAVTSNCKRLVHLDLRGCEQLTANGLMTLAKLPYLEALRLDYCLLPAPASLVSLVQACPSLRRLSAFFLRLGSNMHVEPISVWDDVASLFPDEMLGGGRLTLETDEWRRAYEKRFDLSTPPQKQIEAAVARARREGKLVLLCNALFRSIQHSEDWTMRLHHYVDHNPLLRAQLNDVFVWLALDESLSRVPGLSTPTNDAEYAAIQEGVVEDWPRMIRSIGECPYLFVLDASGQLLSRQRTEPLETLNHYNHRLMFRFVENWRQFLETGGQKKPPAVRQQCQALYDYVGQDATELTFSAGDVIDIIDDSDPSGWWQGELSDGTKGLFPSAFIFIAT